MLGPYKYYLPREIRDIADDQRKHALSQELAEIWVAISDLALALRALVEKADQFKED